MNTTSTSNSISRMMIMGYCTVAYLLFFGAFLYLIGFVTNLLVPISVDQPQIYESTAWSILINLGLIA